jgi:hypothetical protein
MSTGNRKYRRRSRKLSKKQLYGMAAIALTVVSLLAVYAFSNQPNDGFKAAIIDQLSSNADYMNVTFVKAATDMLTAAGYQVTYYKGSDVTVDFYRSLPQHGYKILVFRVHSALYNGTSAPLDFFTSEPYDHNAYVDDQIANRLDIAMYQQGGTRYFGILPSFVTNAMWGNFQNATIILMGCNGLDGQHPSRSQTMITALLSKGAKVVIGWNASVSVTHTDIATERLLYHLLGKNQTVKDAVTSTNNEVAPDEPANELRYEPSPNVDNYTIPHGPSTSVAAKMNSNAALYLWSGITTWASPLFVKEFVPLERSERSLLQLLKVFRYCKV